MSNRRDQPKIVTGIVRLATPIMVGVGLLLITSCGSSESRNEPVPLEERKVELKSDGKLTLQELDQLTYAFADRYCGSISSAVDQIKDHNPDPVQRRVAHRIKLNGVLAMNDIVSGNDPYAQVLDMMVSVTLQGRVWIDEGRAEKTFGARAPILITALHQNTVEVWTLASRVLTQDQLEMIDLLIVGWCREHPNADQVEFVKLDNFSGTKAAGMVTELRSGNGLLAPLDDTNQELKEYRRLAERAFWYSKRAPGIAGIQAEAATNEILAAPEIAELLNSVQSLSKTADSLSVLAATLPGQIVTQIDTHHPKLMATLEAMNQLVTAVTAMSADLRSTLGTADTVSARLLPPPNPQAVPSRPFDISEYITLIAKTNEVLENLNRFAKESDRLTTTERLQPLTNLADERLARIFYYACSLLILIFALGVAFRLIVARISRRNGIAS